MNRRMALRSLFVTGVYAAGLYPLDNMFGNSKGQAEFSDEENRRLISQHRSIGPNEDQIAFLERLSSEFDFVCLGDTYHAQLSITLFALHPDTVRALALGNKNHFFLERSPVNDWVFSGQLSDEDFLKECSELRNSWVDYDNYYHALCQNMQQSMNEDGTRFAPVDQRLADGELFERATLFTRALSFPYRQSSKLQKFLYGKKSIQSPSIMFTLSPLVFSGQILNDRDTAEEIIDLAPNGGTILYGAGHFDDNRNWLSQRHDMPYLLREAGFSVCVVNINHDFSRRSYNGSDADLSVLNPANNPSGIRINNPDFERFLDGNANAIDRSNQDIFFEPD